MSLKNLQVQSSKLKVQKKLQGQSSKRQTGRPLQLSRGGVVGSSLYAWGSHARRLGRGESLENIDPEPIQLFRVTPLPNPLPAAQGEGIQSAVSSLPRTPQ